MVNFYGIVFALGFIIIFFVLKNFFGKKQELATTATTYLILGTIIGARLIYVTYYAPNYFLNNPLRIFYIWNGGVSFHGGLIGVIIALYIFSKKYKIDLLELSDTIIIPITFFLGLGKIANFMNSELYGTITNLPWCVNFKNIEGCRHPVQLYESIKNFLLFFFLIYLKNKHAKKGIITFSFIFIYTSLRFLIDFSREYQTTYFGIFAGQYLNLITFLISGYVLYKLNKKTTSF